VLQPAIRKTKEAHHPVHYLLECRKIDLSADDSSNMSGHYLIYEQMTAAA